MRVKGVDGVWAIGDAAHVPDPLDLERPSPPTAQHAIRQGRKVADNVILTMSDRKPRQFTYKTLGVFVDLGRGKAVASTVGLRWSGVPAWFIARTYHLASMPGTTRKIRLVADWTVGLFFGRDGSELGRLGHPGRLDETDTDQIALGGEATSSGQPGSDLAPADDDATDRDAQEAPPVESPAGD
jgi:NADH dehydrogenase